VLFVHMLSATVTASVTSTKLSNGNPVSTGIIGIYPGPPSLCGATNAGVSATAGEETASCA